MKFVIVTPIWKEVLSPEELILLKITNQTNSSLPKYFLTPNQLNIEFYKKNFPDWEYLRISRYHLSSIERYNQYMLRPDLYKKLKHFEFLVICQTDAVLVKNISSIKINDIDYVGAPWHPSHVVTIPQLYGLRGVTKLFQILGITEDLKVGNGGLSIRRTSVFESITKKLFYRKFIKINEDVYFSFLGKKNKIKCATSTIAESIFNETSLVDKKYLPDVYGFHAIQKWNSDLANDLMSKNID